MGTKWKQSRNQNPKVGQEWEQSGNKVGTRTPKWEQEWEQSENKVGTRTPNGNKVGTKWEQEPKVGTKWKQEPQSGNKVGTKWEEESGNKNLNVGEVQRQLFLSSQNTLYMRNILAQWSCFIAYPQSYNHHNL